MEGCKSHASNYIAPEVILGKKEGLSSDIYSFGKMLEAVVSGRSFCASCKEVFSERTALAASDRPSTEKVSLLLSEVYTRFKSQMSQ